MGLATRLFGSGVAFALAILSFISAGQAQSGVGVQRHDREALFQRILANPADLDANFRFAEMATAAGDYEAAIGALERMIFYNPNLPRVRLELGILYFRLGSYAMARSYFESAVAGPDVPSEVTLRVDAFLAEIDRRLRTVQWSGFAQVGLRHQTNASAGPSNPLVRALGQDAILDRRFVQRPDWNAFAQGAVRHIYDFENQRGDVWETLFSTYHARQFTIERLNTNIVDLQTGPRLALAPDSLPGAYVRPYLLGSFVWLGDAPYLGSIGAGVGLGSTIGLVQVEPFVEVRRREFRNSPTYRTADEQSGTVWSAGAVLGSPLYGPLRWQGRIAVSSNDTSDRYGYYGYGQVAADVAFPVDFAGPWGNGPWTFVPYIGFSQFRYDEPNQIIDPSVKRYDREWRVGAGLDMPVYQNIGLGVQVTYSTVASNLPNFRTRNFAISFGPTLRF
ncbi:tetratricopeptide repeat protein [Microvirga pakistanensis]|uniref:tetratricopeptide repeat protein n=1 Tax=Microvirga pakistanensis TaxID=1682650 RepID=UPI00106D7C77|nr:tetratricopeptide repeat protein [Microvirga pakistanensis]